MKIYNNVRGTMKYVPTVEVNKDTVYIRSDIERIEEMEFSGWEYNEIQYPLQEYISTINYLGKELTQERLKSMQKTNIINALGQEVTKLKLEIMQLKGGEA